MRISVKAVICGVVLVTMGGVAFAGFAKSEEAIRYRKAVMDVIGQHFGRIAAVVQGKSSYEKNDVEQNAMVIRTMAELPWEAMVFPGSDQGDTTLKASAMQDKEKFMAVARQFESATQKLAEAAKSGDLGAIKTQFGEVAGACKTCHSAYRNR